MATTASQKDWRTAAYINAAMSHAIYKTLGDSTIYGEIPGIQGVYANEPTREACERELASVLDGWLQLRLAWQRPIPTVDGIDLTSS
ncbi:MAG TPA: type II toxin-antitoxin system HicB family antitoxin [Chloroflexia bacterium]|nr:type II toxin-antitoxin system HicB family antitoxin [Chloroflexia bacterium]